jgi:hypothetical protein
MPITPKTLVQGMLLAASAPASPGAYSPAVLTTATVRHMRFVNTDTVARIVTVHCVASGDVVGAKNRILGPVSLDPDQTLIDDSIVEMMTGDFLSPFASAAGVVAFRADGFEVT